MMFATDLLEPPRARRLRWMGAALFVVAAHVGCTALALMPWQADDADDAAASPVVVEMLPAATATPVDSPDVAHGPLTEEAMLTPQAAKETKEEVEKEMPTVEPSPAPDPEVALPTPHPVTDKKPDEEKPQEDKPKQQSADQVVAAAIAGNAKGRVVVVPGWHNKVAAILLQYLPQPLVSMAVRAGSAKYHLEG